MKAKIKETGEIAEFSTGKNLQGETILLKVGTSSIFSLDEVEPIADIDYQQVRIQAAIAAMQGMMSSEFYCNIKTRNDAAYSKYREKWGVTQITREAVRYADALIEELKEGGQDGNHNH